VDTASTAIENINIAKQALAEAQTLTDVLEIRDAAVAAQAYASAKGADEAAQIAVEIKLRSERKAGVFLKAQPKQAGARTKRSDNMSPHELPPTLAELGVTKKESSRWQQIADIPEEKFENYITNSKKKTQSALLAEAKKTTTGAHVGHATGEFEWYTPKTIIDAAREVMGNIDLDPASCDYANQFIQADKFYSIEDDGLEQEWHGNVWMNPPYTQPIVTEFCNLLVENYVQNKVPQACVLVNNATETKFYQNMLNHARAVCFIKGRVKFVDPKGDSSGAPLQGQTVLYFGTHPRRFGEVFIKLGVVLYA